jgi:hypothetical protein
MMSSRRAWSLDPPSSRAMYRIFGFLSTGKCFATRSCLAAMAKHVYTMNNDL